MKRRVHLRLPNKQQGVALMIVILVFALVTILSVGMYNRQGLFLQKAGNIAAQTQAYQYALASEIYGKRLLKADWDDDQKDKFVDDLEQVQSSILFPVEEAFLEAQFNDVQGKLNVNELVDLAGKPRPLVVARFKALFDRLAIETVKVDTLIDWIDENQQDSNFDGAEDGEYLSLTPPYRNAGQPFVHLSELMLLPAISEQEYQLLLEHVTALPSGYSSLNVNTASPEVLQSLASGISDRQVEQLVSARENQAWEDVASFKSEPALKGVTLDTEGLSVNSKFFEIATRITLSDRVVRLVSLVYRNATDGEMTVVMRDQGQKYLITKEKVEL